MNNEFRGFQWLRINEKAKRDSFVHNITMIFNAYSNATECCILNL